MLAVGACLFGTSEQSFGVELKPLHVKFHEAALAALASISPKWSEMVWSQSEHMRIVKPGSMRSSRASLGRWCACRL